MQQLSIAEASHLVHGFTLADVDRASIIATKKTNHYPIDEDDRQAAAWHAIVVYLYECGCGWGSCNRPAGVTFPDILIAGMRGISDEASSHAQTHGISARHPGARAPKFSLYWGTANETSDDASTPDGATAIRGARKGQSRDDGFSDRLCERLALRTVLAGLPPLDFETIVTLAVFDNAGHQAAEALGLNYKTYATRIARARDRATRAWFEPSELPAPKKVTSDACREGHPRAEHGRLGSNGKWTCKLCQKRNAQRWRANNRERSNELARESMRRTRGGLVTEHADPAA